MTHQGAVHNIPLLLLLQLMVIGTSLAIEDSCRVSSSGTGPIDHWPTVENADTCKLEHCSREMVSWIPANTMYCNFEVLKIYFHEALCMLDPTCLTSLSCTSECKGDSFVAGLCAYECGEAGLRVHTYTAMLTCWGIHHCQESRPNPAGVCAASSLDEVNSN